MSKRKKKNKAKKIIKSTLIIVITFIIIIFLYNTYANIEINQTDYKTERTISTANEQTVETVIENSEKISTMLEKAMGSVVGISKLKSNGNSIFSTSNEDALGIGTGIIVREDGYILSNEHVTGSKFSTCYITLESGKKQEGKVVWSDSDLDLSLTKIDAKNLSTINLGDSSKIKVGENVYAIGNPIGFEFRRTVTSGIISAKNRSIKLEENNSTSYMSDLIQTDATINPGNSGGPLINPNGEVIGINTVKISSADGIGFAIPINVVKGVIESFKNTGKFEQPTLGIYVYDKDVIPYLDNNIITFTKGIYVAQINKNGPAYNTELKEGDIINTVENDPATSDIDDENEEDEETPPEVIAETGKEELKEIGYEDPTDEQGTAFINNSINFVYADKGERSPAFDYKPVLKTTVITINTSHKFYTSFLSKIYSNAEVKTTFELFLASLIQSVRKTDPYQAVQNDRLMTTWYNRLNNYIAEQLNPRDMK